MMATTTDWKENQKNVLHYLINEEVKLRSAWRTVTLSMAKCATSGRFTDCSTRLA